MLLHLCVILFIPHQSLHDQPPGGGVCIPGRFGLCIQRICIRRVCLQGDFSSRGVGRPPPRSASRGLVDPPDIQWDPTGYSQQEGGTHPIGMLSCLFHFLTSNSPVCVFQCIVVTVGDGGFHTEYSYDYVTFWDSTSHSGMTSCLIRQLNEWLLGAINSEQG